MTRPRNAPSVLHRYDAAAAAARENTDDARGQKFRLEQRVGPMSWKHVGSAPSLARAKLSAGRRGGMIRAIDLRTKRVVGQWVEGDPYDG